MPAVHSKLPVLSLLQSLEGFDQPHSCTPERDINREALVDVAPDREELLLSNKPIEEIRQALKLRVNSAYGHWLYRTQKRRDVKLRDATTRLSVFGRVGSENMDTSTQESRNDTVTNRRSSAQVVRRVLSASSVYSASRQESGQGDHDIWGGPRLSTQQKLISPRPLGPTHILVVYAMQPSKPIILPRDNMATVRRRPAASTYSEVLELPINDLLFILNVPNLMSDSAEGRLIPILPRRLHKEMPKVLMHVPHLDTFPELVVYLHTKNQAALFRALVPEWMRDIMHPFPQPRQAAVALNPVGTVGSSASFTTFDSSKVKKLFKLVAGSTSSSSLDTLGSSASSSTIAAPEMVRSISTIAVEIAEAAEDLDSEDDVLLRIATLLDALRDNLNHIGYFGKDLWTELNATRDIMLRAISHQARVAPETDAD
ncbi:hypothetical protein BDZ97DRAFT_635703 [Flammula alnicola]|nr:hypothetical protein BDZ97DRAFT_635703 [Flammula alnicola]